MVTLDLDTRVDRWDGLSYPDYIKALADAYCQAVANALAPRLGDYANAELSMLPVYAYETGSDLYVEALGDEQKRRSLEYVRRIQFKAGTAKGWRLFCESMTALGALAYVKGETPERTTRVSLYITPPAGFTAGPEFLPIVTRIARQELVPYDLILDAVHLTNAGRLTEYQQVVGQTGKVYLDYWRYI